MPENDNVNVKIAPNSVQILNNYTSLCVSTGKPASEVAAGDYLVMRSSDATVASQAWIYADNPGPIAWAGNTSLQIGWDQFGKVLLVTAPDGLIFSFTSSPGTFVNNDNGTDEYLTWAGVLGNPAHTPLKAEPSYLSFTCDWTLIPR